MIALWMRVVADTLKIVLGMSLVVVAAVLAKVFWGSFPGFRCSLVPKGGLSDSVER